MSRILALIAAGAVANVIIGNPADYPDAIDVTDTDPRPGPGWSYDGTRFARPAVLAIVEPRRITRLAFDQRFTQAERIAIDLASIDDPAATTETRQRAASLRDMRHQVNNATFIDLDRPDTRAGVEQLETAGLIGVGRAAEILDAPVQPHERPQA
jgi:hypothetical protein